MKIPYRFSEDKIVKSLQDYLDGTYSTARDNALKYLLRFGKKEGKNPKDLYKAMHYIILMLYCLKKEAKDATASGE